MKYIPKQGDIIFLELENLSFLVISNRVYNNFTYQSIVCPIKVTNKPYPLHVNLKPELKTKGTIICDELKTLTLCNYKVVFCEKVPLDILEECIDIINSSIEII